MRRALYRSGLLLIISVLVLALSDPPLTAASAAADVQPMRASADAISTGCPTALGGDNHQVTWHSFLDEVATFGVCKPVPATVLMVKQEPVPGDAAGAALVEGEHRA